LVGKLGGSDIVGSMRKSMFYALVCVYRSVGILLGVNWLGKELKEVKNQLNRISLMIELVVICVGRN
jgi:hypothetical protein